MDKITFNEEPAGTVSTMPQKASMMTNFIISLGIAKAQKDAEYILLGSAILMFIAATFVLVRAESQYAPPVHVDPSSAQFQKEFDTPHPVRPE